jgi:hypothetical protein
MLINPLSINIPLEQEDKENGKREEHKLIFDYTRILHPDIQSLRIYKLVTIFFLSLQPFPSQNPLPYIVNDLSLP